MNTEHQGISYGHSTKAVRVARLAASSELPVNVTNRLRYVVQYPSRTTCDTLLPYLLRGAD